MHISVKTITGMLVFQGAVSDEATVFGLKELVQAGHGVSPDAQRLIYGGKELIDELPLHKYGIADGAVISLITH